MIPYKWEVWLVDMPFEEGIGSKIRPCLVIASQGGDMIVGKMTTHPPRDGYPYEYEMLDWKGAGLNCQTTLRLSKMPKLHSSSFIKKLGIIQPVDQINVRNILKAILSSAK